jgi:hypothetical protein
MLKTTCAASFHSPYNAPRHVTLSSRPQPPPPRHAPQTRPAPAAARPAGPAALPLDVLPPPLADFCSTAADALAAAGAALGNAWELAVTDSHVQTAPLFVALVGPPGSGKSPALRLACSPLLAAQADDLAAWQARRDAHLALPDPIRVVAPAPPPPRRLVLDDFTPEALSAVLRDNPKGICVVKDELAALFAGLGPRRGGRGHDRQVLLSVWAGADVVVDRKGLDGPSLVRRPFVAVVGGIQPRVLQRLRPGPDDDGDGLLDRFLFAYPSRRRKRS